MFDPAMFDRGGDIRGDYPRQINEELAWFVGRYFVRFLRSGEEALPAPRILVGRDGRISSPVLYRALIDGIAAESGVPIPCGLATTDMICWGVGAGRYDATAGIIVTASHNPPEYNGIKLFAPDNEPDKLPAVQLVSPRDHLKKFFEEDIKGRRPQAALMENPSYQYPSELVTLCEDFVEWAAQWAPSRKEFDETTVIDPGNGVGSIFIDRLKAQLPAAKIESIAAQIDGRFPSRPSNPGLAGAVKDLQAKVRELNASFGVAFDGDADRVFMVDERGEFVPGDHLLAAIVKTALETSEGETIAFVATCSWLLVETIRRMGGRPIVSKVGQVTLKQVMKETGAIFGGESSAHFNYAKSYYQDSGVIALMGLWEYLHDNQLALSKLVSDLEPWPQSGEINIRIQSDDWSSIGRKVVEKIVELYSSDEKSKECYVLELDEVSVFFPWREDVPTVEDLFPKDEEKNPDGKTFRHVHPDYSPDWWFNIRRSNNEPLMRINIECKDGSVLKEKTLEIVNLARKLCLDVGNCGTEVVDWGRVGELQSDESFAGQG